MAHSDQIWSRMPHMGGHNRYNAFWTQYMDFWDFLRFQKSFIRSYIGLFWSPNRGPNGSKWTSDAYSVNMGQLDHYVVFGTKSGAIQDIQRGKKCPKGIKQTTAEHR